MSKSINSALKARISRNSAGFIVLKVRPATVTASNSASLMAISVMVNTSRHDDIAHRFDRRAGTQPRCQCERGERTARETGHATGQHTD